MALSYMTAPCSFQMTLAGGEFDEEVVIANAGVIQVTNSEAAQFDVGVLTNFGAPGSGQEAVFEVPPLYDSAGDPISADTWVRPAFERSPVLVRLRVRCDSNGTASVDVT